MVYRMLEPYINHYQKHKNFFLDIYDVNITTSVSSKVTYSLSLEIFKLKIFNSKILRLKVTTLDIFLNYNVLFYLKII